MTIAALERTRERLAQCFLYIRAAKDIRAAEDWDSADDLLDNFDFDAFLNTGSADDPGTTIESFRYPES